MKRNFDLAKQILLKMESLPTSRNDSRITIDGYQPDEISYHVYLLDSAGLVEASDCGGPIEPMWIPHSLTWSGHEFLALAVAKNNTIWQKAKDYIKTKGGALTFETLKTVLAKFANDTIS